MKRINQDGRRKLRKKRRWTLKQSQFNVLHQKPHPDIEDKNDPILKSILSQNKRKWEVYHESASQNRHSLTDHERHSSLAVGRLDGYQYFAQATTMSVGTNY
ncbi:hypothetical protein NQ317_003588 [Molorchus minor]|uniref:Uncharacterized protein n=1 Tax=Molorchus minor TaxID=1323400 RepID=A0ABQ9JE45_9CUCU|nr:hypothetical protein NQ317_003588 [Molorchus minor]